jgi:hypothetical protein
VRIRHLISGQFLCIRQTYTNEAGVLRHESSITPCTKINQGGSVAKRAPSPGKSVASTVIPFEQYDQSIFLEQGSKSSDGNLTEKERKKLERKAYLNKVRSNSSVATTSEPDDSGLFLIFSCNYDTADEDLGPSGPGFGVGSSSESKKVMTFEESVYFQHELTSCRLKLHDSMLSLEESSDGYCNSDSLWSEYQGDIPLQPSDPSEPKVSILTSGNANACRIDEVDVEEVRDIMFAIRFVPLLSRAIMCVQNPSRQRNASPSAVYRQLSSGLYTLSKWCVLKGGNEAHLSESSADMKAAARRESIISIGGNSDISENSDDESVVAVDTRMRTLTVVERMDRVEYPALLDNMNDPHTNRSHSDSVGQREKIDAVSRSTIKRRQELLSDCRLLEMALHFANIVFNLVREVDVQLSEVKNLLEEEDEDFDQTMEKGRFGGLKKVNLDPSPPPKVLLDCCLLVHELIRSSVSLDNQKNAMKIVSIPGKWH